jgi:hypothetical protein
MSDRRWLIAVGCAVLVCVLDWACLRALSPHEETTTETTTETTVEASGGSTVTTFNFQNVAGKTSWGILLIVAVSATVAMKRREKAVDDLIESVESVGDASRLVKSQVRSKKNKYIDKRVAKLTNGAKP